MKSLIILLFVFCSSLQATVSPKTVRFIYMVSVDKQVNPEFIDAIDMAARNVQAWYKTQMGTTFRLNDPIVEVVQAEKTANWISNNPSSEDKYYWGYYNTYSEVVKLTDIAYNDPNYVWIVYSDGRVGGAGGASIAIMGIDDLMGLLGRHTEQKEVNRWIAGLGHELGHALGLAHPTDTKKYAEAIMCMGIYGRYPNKTYLTPEDKQILSVSPFFFDDQGHPNSGTLEDLEKFEFYLGHFTRQQNTKDKQIFWVETSKNSKAEFKFIEVDHDEEYYHLKATDREVELLIPIDSGISLMSPDKGKTWVGLYLVWKI